MDWYSNRFLNTNLYIAALLLTVGITGCTSKKESYINRITAPSSPTGAVPAAPVITIPVATLYVSNSSSLTISGTCEDLALVSLSGSYIDSQTCVSNTFSFLINKTVDGNYPFSVSQTNMNGTSSSNSVTWTRDTTAPTTPTLISPASSPFVSGDTTFLVTGTCESGATVAMTGDSASSTTCSIGGTFSHSITKSSDGTYNFSFIQTDAATNSSSALTFQWTRNSSVPPTPTISVPSASPYYSNGSALTISGTCTAGFTITLGGNVTAGQITAPVGSLTQTCTGGGSYSYTFTKSSDATYTLSVKQTNLSLIDSANATQIWNRDTVTPSAPTITTPSTNPHYSTNNLTISGACECRRRT